MLLMLLMTAVRAAWLSRPIAGMVAGLCGVVVTYLLLSQDLISPWRATAYALVSGVVVGVAAQSAVAAVRTSAAFGFVVTVVLYVSIGLARGKLRGQLNRKRVVEYLLVAAAGLLVVMVSGL
jgi:zinc transporter ZupT